MRTEEHEEQAGGMALTSWLPARNNTNTGRTPRVTAE